MAEYSEVPQPDREAQRILEKVTINRPFLLFPQDETEDTGKFREYPQYRRKVLLDTRELLPTGDDFPLIPLTLNAQYSRADRSYAVTPYHPENGYPLDEKDFDADTRKEKIDAMKDKLIDHTLDPLWFRADIYYHDLENLGILSRDKTNSDYAFTNPEVQQVFERLRLSVTLPHIKQQSPNGTERETSLSYTAAYPQFSPSISAMHLGYTWHPQDTPPLPDLTKQHNKYSFSGRPGHSLFVPDTPELAHSWKGLVILLPENIPHDQLANF